MRLMTLVVAAGLLWPASSFSLDQTTSYKTSNELYEDCTAASGSPEMAFCTGYVLGLSDILRTLKLECLPKDTAVGQIVDVVIDYLHDHPAARYYSASSAAGLALMKAFVCQYNAPPDRPK